MQCISVNLYYAQISTARHSAWGASESLSDSTLHKRQLIDLTPSEKAYKDSSE